MTNLALPYISRTGIISGRKRALDRQLTSTQKRARRLVCWPGGGSWPMTRVATATVYRFRAGLFLACLDRRAPSAHFASLAPSRSHLPGLAVCPIRSVPAGAGAGISPRQHAGPRPGLPQPPVVATSLASRPSSARLCSRSILAILSPSTRRLSSSPSRCPDRFPAPTHHILRRSHLILGPSFRASNLGLPYFGIDGMLKRPAEPVSAT